MSGRVKRVEQLRIEWTKFALGEKNHWSVVAYEASRIELVDFLSMLSGFFRKRKSDLRVLLRTERHGS